MKRAQLSSEDFNYHLADEQIAKYPLTNRNESRLLTYQKGQIGEDTFARLNKHLPANSCLVFNNSKVIAARLRFKTPNGANIEVFCLEPFQSTVEQSLNKTETCQWQCMVGNLKRFKTELSSSIAGVELKVKIIEKRDTDVIVSFSWTGGIPFSKILEEAGEIPLPPYLNRKTEASDKSNYQTIYAQQEGAVAAPTAGLHFVENQMKALQQEGHHLAYLTLHVGAGTFRVVKADRLQEHKMHEERIVIDLDTLEKLSKLGGKLIAVGTTSLRSLESLYWLAVKRKTREDHSINFISQDDAYELNSHWTWEEALNYLIDELKNQGKKQLDFHSALFIMPGYEWKAISGLITNFHQPKSTLLALVAAWIGKDWKAVYDYALTNNFRFLSYGDSSILIK